MYLINNCQVIVIINPHLLNMSTNDYMYKESNKNIFKKFTRLFQKWFLQIINKH